MATTTAAAGPMAALVDSPATRTVEVERLFIAIDVEMKGSVDRSAIRTLMMTLRQGHELPALVEDEVEAVFVSIFGREGHGRIDRDEFTKALLAWLAMHDDRPHIFRITRPGRPFDRRRVHTELSMLFAQNEPASTRRTLARRTSPDDEVDRLRRGGAQATLREREGTLAKLVATTEGAGHMLLQAYEAVHSLDPEVVLQGLAFLRELLEELETLASPAERFHLRYRVWSVFVALTQSPASSAAQVKPFLPLVYCVAGLLAEETTNGAIKEAACWVLHYTLLGPRVPSTSPSDPFHPSSFVDIKHKLATTYAFLPTVWKVVVDAIEAPIRVSALRALASFVEHHLDALRAVLQMRLLFEMLQLLKQWDLTTDADLARSGTYLLAVLCGHTHVHASAPTAGRDVIKDHLLSVKDAQSVEGVALAVWDLLQLTADPLARAHVVLALRHLIPLCSEAPGFDYVTQLITLLEEGLCGLQSAIMAGDAQSVEQGQYAELTVAVALSLLDALDSERNMEYALSWSTQLLERTREMLKLPSTCSRVMVLGLELAELMGRQQHYEQVLSLTEALTSLLHRLDCPEAQLRVVRVLTCLSCADPPKVYRIVSRGLVSALFQTFSRFKVIDPVLLDVYGIPHYTWQADLVRGAISILRTVLAIVDARCRSLFLTVFNVSQVQAAMDLHYLLCKAVLERVLVPTQAVIDMNDTLRMLVSEIRALHMDEQSLGAKAVTTLAAECLDAWREDLRALSVSPHPLSLAEVLDTESGMGADNEPQICCADYTGRPVHVRIVPVWPGARDVVTAVPSSACLRELRRHVFQLYHVDEETIQLTHILPHGPPGTRTELKEDESLTAMLKLFAEGKEVMIISVSCGPAVQRMSQAEPLVTPALEADVHDALSELGIHTDDEDVATLLTDVSSYFSDFGVANTEASGLSWSDLRELFVPPYAYVDPRREAFISGGLRLMWDLLDAGNGYLTYFQLAVGGAVFTLGDAEQRLKFIFNSLSPSGAHQPRMMSKASLDKLFELVFCRSRPVADAHRMSDRAYSRSGSQTRDSLDYDAFRAAVRSNEAVLDALTNFRVLEDDPGLHRCLQRAIDYDMGDTTGRAIMCRQRRGQWQKGWQQQQMEMQMQHNRTQYLNGYGAGWMGGGRVWQDGYGGDWQQWGRRNGYRGRGRHRQRW